jgi:cytochrome c-type biogenesis protein CcmH/NrfG
MRGRMGGMEEQLRRLIELQTEQNQLLRKYLWRIRFSLLTLLILTTLVAVGLWFTFATVRSLHQQLLPEGLAPGEAPQGGGLF